MTSVLSQNKDLDVRLPTTYNARPQSNLLTRAEMERVGTVNAMAAFIPATDDLKLAMNKHLRKRSVNGVPGWQEKIAKEAVNEQVNLCAKTKEHYWGIIYELIDNEVEFRDTFDISLKELTPAFINTQIYNKPFLPTHMFRGEGRLIGKDGTVLYAGHRNYSTCLKRIYLYMRIAGVIE